MRMIAVACLALSLSCVSYAQQDKEEQLSDAQLDKWSVVYLERAKGYEIRRGEDGRELQLKPEPVTRWTNLVVSPDLTHGECFVWTVDGRAEAFASIFSYNHGGVRTIAHAFNTFSRHTLLASHGGGTFWTPRPFDADAMKEVPVEMKVAETRTLRLVQMRRIARSFSARSGDGDKALELRLLATPVYRNEQESKQAIDGALFAFVTGTDPEVMLLLEARGEDDPAWHYQLFRHSHLSLRARFNGEQVWEDIRGAREYSVPGMERQYRSQHHIDSRPLMLP